ncbi:MAG TPA: hypothetical protein VGS11_11405 [Candidatus Bathyarchaeia archaeon]|nr:hypothetical protein [Candidatus Bathyarchaeia archaeon]
MNLQRRTTSRDGGVFGYHDPQSDLCLIFRWDGAAITNDGKIVLFEEEMPSFNPLHIQGHLTRLLFMIQSGEAIEKLLWIVPEARYVDLDKIVFPWVRIWEASFCHRFPFIEYRDENGRYLGPLGTSQNRKHRAKLSKAKPIRVEVIPNLACLRCERNDVATAALETTTVPD